MAERIGIFGGSFDPVHNGHVSVVRSFLKSRLIHNIWIIPASLPPHKQSLELTPFHHRQRMLEIAFKAENLQEFVKISDIEKRLPSPSYTVQTLRHLQQENPDHLFYLCMGEDSLKTLNSWYEYKTILQLVSLVVAERPGFRKTDIEPNILEKTIFVEHQPVDISSTDVRSLQEGAGGITNVEKVPDNVDSYIKQHRLYQTNNTRS